MNFPSDLTVAAVKNSSIQNIAGVCVNSTAFLQQLNESVQRLMTFGNFWNTVIKGRICVYTGCITWPRWVGTVLAMNIGQQSRQIQNRWYDFVPLSTGDCSSSRCRSSNVTIVDDGITPVFQNIPCGTPMYVRAYARVRADLGKTITIYGVDEFGNEMMVREAISGEWSTGALLTLASPYAQSGKRFREITRASKDLTTGPVDLYAYDSDNDILYELGHYDPSETEPRYRHSTIRGGVRSGCCSANGSRLQSIEFLAKMKFIPVVQDSDIVQIDNIEAIKLMMQAGRLEEAGDDESAAKKQALAIKELNRQLADKLPLSQINIQVLPEGTADPRRAGIGQIM